MAFFRPSTLRTDFFSRVGHVYIKESFKTIFSMSYGSGKSSMDERVKA